jgi:hypothetical protein
MNDGETRESIPQSVEMEGESYPDDNLSVSPHERTKYDQLDNEENIEAEDVDDDTLVLDVNSNDSKNNTQPQTPQLKEHKFRTLNTIHVLGDLHGWAPGLITYLIEHKLAHIEINGVVLGIDGSLDARSMINIFGRDSTMSSSELPNAGLSGRPGFEECINGSGHNRIKARWIGDKKTGFVQLGDVIDRADHSELACEILRQLVIDSPSNVFVLVGNHEQFALEDEYDNWYLNEKRNAVIDGRMGPREWARNHLRFMPNLDLDDIERSRLVFESYKESVQLLYLTQAAAQQEALSIDHGLDEETISTLLSDGWNPYNQISRISSKYCEKGTQFPGALVSIVIGETLFHHAEPNQKISNLVSEMNWEKMFGWANYVHGGYNLQASPHSYLLWSRGASDGASTNFPASQAMLEQISTHWPGLYNIVHGHTPTVTISEFEEVTKNESKPVSYLAESILNTPKYGQASRIRIYNIDEGLSPVYYQGKDDPENPCRTPVGLRITKPSHRDSPICAHTSSDPLYVHEQGRSVRTDTRKLWVWGKGKYRNNNSYVWKEVGPDSHQICIEFDGLMFIAEVSSVGKELLSRNISGYPILKNLLIYLLDDADILPKHVKRQPPKGALSHIRVDNSEPHLTHMLTPKKSWETAKAIRLVALGIVNGQKKNTTHLFSANFTRKVRPINLLNIGHESDTIQINPGAIKKYELPHGNDAFCVSLEKNDEMLSKKINQWLGQVVISSKIEFKIPICLGLNPLEAYSDKITTTKLNKKEVSLWEIPKKSPDIRDIPSKKKEEKPIKNTVKTDLRSINRPDIRSKKSRIGSTEGKIASQKFSRGGEKKSPSINSGLEKLPNSSIQNIKNKPAESSEVNPNIEVKKAKTAPSNRRKSSNEVLPTGSSIKIGAATKITFSSEDCVKILKSEIGATVKALSCKFMVEYSKEWGYIHIYLFDASGEKQLFHFEIVKSVFTDPSFDKNKLKPNVKKKRDGLNPKFLKTLIGYVHGILADNLREN